MEASPALRRSISQGLGRSRCCRPGPSNTQIASQALQLHKLFATRPFTSASHVQSQDVSSPPPQPQPVSQDGNMNDAVGTLPASTSQAKSNAARDKDRIDLSSLPGLPSSYIPPNRPRSRPSSSAEKLEAMLAESKKGKPVANRFVRTIQQTEAQNSTSRSPSFSSIWSPATTTTTPTPSTPAPSLNYSYVKTMLDNLAPSPSPSSSTEERIPLRLHPSLGRSQPVDNQRGIDLVRAFRLLDLKCATNGVRKDEISQRFHVRRGQKRKLMRSARWRVAFRKGFLEECARIRRMKNQGW